MFFALKHHRAAIDRVNFLYSEGTCPSTSEEGVTPKARLSAIIFLSKRADLAMGSHISRTARGGVRLDTVRFASEICVDVCADGSICVMICKCGAEESPKTLFSKSVSDTFLNSLASLLPDPFARTDFPFHLVPLSGEVDRDIMDVWSAKSVMTDSGRYLSIGTKASTHGFNRLCVKIEHEATQTFETMRDAIRTAVLSGFDFRVGRTMEGSSFLSLHEIEHIPERIAKAITFFCGMTLSEVRMQTAEFRKQKESSVYLTEA